MSGSSSSDYSGGFDVSDRCESLVIDTQLSSPKEDVIAGVVVNSVLEVTVQAIGGVSVVVVTHQGQLAGGIAAPEVNRLRECISKGVAYGATVLSVNDGQVRVRIKTRLH